MSRIEEHYYSTTVKSLLKAFGIWHRDKSRLVLVQRTVITLVIVSYLCMQFLVLFTTKFTLALFIKVTSLACPFTIAIMQYFTFFYISDDILNMHNRIEEDWKLIRNKMEHDIIKKNARSTRFVFDLVLLFTCGILIASVVIQLLPIILDVILPLDEPRQRELLLKVEYFVPQNKYFYTIMLHEIVYILVSVAVTYTTAMQIFVFVFHIFGMFKIARHRIRYSTENSVLQYVANSEKERAIRRKIVYAVIAHIRAQEFSNIMMSSFNAPYCSIAILGVISLSINLYGIIEAVAISKLPQNAVVYFICVVIHLVYMFIAMFLGQKIIDYNDEVFSVIYNTSWYLMPISSQKLLLFIIQKAVKEFTITIGFIFVAKIENFATLVNTSLSYVAVMYSCTH